MQSIKYSLFLHKKKCLLRTKLSAPVERQKHDARHIAQVGYDLGLPWDRARDTRSFFVLRLYRDFVKIIKY